MASRTRNVNLADVFLSPPFENDTQFYLDEVKMCAHLRGKSIFLFFQMSTLSLSSPVQQE